MVLSHDKKYIIVSKEKELVLINPDDLTLFRTVIVSKQLKSITFEN
jgi:hypothetical protein